MSGKGDSKENERIMVGISNPRIGNRTRCETEKGKKVKLKDSIQNLTAAADDEVKDSSSDKMNKKYKREGSNGDKDTEKQHWRWHFREQEVTDQDFDSTVPRLKIISRMSFSKILPSEGDGDAPTENQNNDRFHGQDGQDQGQPFKFATKVKIHNVSNLPMTYSVRPSCIDTFKIIPQVGWLPPRAVEWVEIQMKKPVKKGAQAINACVFVFAAPIFHKQYTKRNHLNLLWRAFGSHMFPLFHAESHCIQMQGIAISGHPTNYYLETTNSSMLDAIVSKSCDCAILRSKNWKELTDEEYELLWSGMSLDYPNKFAWECRLRELKRIESTGLHKTNRRRKGKVALSSMAFLIFGLTVVASVGFSTWMALVEWTEQ